MSGVELIIFGAGPAVGLGISFIAWLYEGYYTATSEVVSSTAIVEFNGSTDFNHRPRPLR